jgi:hypothetical protein
MIERLPQYVALAEEVCAVTERMAGQATAWLKTTGHKQTFGDRAVTNRCLEIDSALRALIDDARAGFWSWMAQGKSAMRWHLALLLAASFAASPVDGVAAEKQIADVKDLAGTWRGWVMAESGRERATMVVDEDGTYKASTTRGTLSQGMFYLRDGKLRYRSTRTTGTASLSEDQGKTILTMMPVDPTADTGRTEYERVK